MNLTTLRYLVEAIDAGTLQAAARRLGVSQPTLSTQLARLEAELDATLLERGRKGVRATPAGQRVAAEAAAVLDAASRLREAAREPGDALAGDLRLGALPTVGPYAMPRLLPRLRRSHPELRLLLREEPTETLLGRLSAGAFGSSLNLDAAILALPLESPGMHLAPLLREPLRAVLPAEHPLALGGGPVSVRDLAGESMLLLEDGHCLTDQTISLCRRAGGRGRPLEPASWAATSVESLRQMVAAGIGCAVLPEMAVSGRLGRVAGVSVRPLKEEPTRELVLAFRETHPRFGALVKLARAMAGWLTDACRSHAGASGRQLPGRATRAGGDRRADRID